MTTQTVAVFIIAAISVLVLLAVATSASTIIQGTIRNAQIASQGGVNAVGEITVDLSNIDWGLLNPSDKSIEVVTVTSTANYPQALSYSTANWQPANATEYLTLTWNNTGVLNAGASKHIEFTLTASPASPATNFAFNIIITGTQI